MAPRAEMSGCISIPHVVQYCTGFGTVSSPPGELKEYPVQYLDILEGILLLLTDPLPWQATGSNGGLRARTSLRAKDGRPVMFLNLVTALHVLRTRETVAFYSGEYHSAADAIGLPQPIANAMIRAGDWQLPKEHEYFKLLNNLAVCLMQRG